MDTSSEMTSREKSIFMLGALYGMAYDAKMKVCSKTVPFMT